MSLWIVPLRTATCASWISTPRARRIRPAIVQSTPWSRAGIPPHLDTVRQIWCRVHLFYLLCVARRFAHEWSYSLAQSLWWMVLFTDQSGSRSMCKSHHCNCQCRFGEDLGLLGGRERCQEPFSIISECSFLVRLIKGSWHPLITSWHPLITSCQAIYKSGDAPPVLNVRDFSFPCAKTPFL